MIGSFHPNWHILPAAQKNLWSQLAPTVRHGLVLYGGTAIALRLGHRVSVDFDFFTDEPLDHLKLRATMPFLNEATTLQESAQTLTVATGNPSADGSGVKVSVFGSIKFGRVGTPELSDDGMILAASLDDLMATKLKVILQRVEAKDYRDILAMIDAGVSLPRGLASARKLFGKTFQPSESLKAMTWFEGGDLETLTATGQAALIRAAGSVRDLPIVSLLSSRLTADA